MWYGDSKSQAGAPGSENRQHPCEIVLAFLIARSSAARFLGTPPLYAVHLKGAADAFSPQHS